MAKDSYPDLDVGKETGVSPSRLRIGGRNVTVVGGILDGSEAYFDNGVMSSKSKAEQGIAFGPEVLRALGGRKVYALWLAAVRDAEGRPGWFGLTAGEMRIDVAKKEGFRDPNSFQLKLTDAAQGRCAVFQLKDEQKKALCGLLRRQPDLWKNAVRTFRDTLSAAMPELLDLDSAGNAGEAPAAGQGSPRVDLGAAGGIPARTLRSYGRDVTVVGVVVDGAKAEWDNGVLESKSRVEQGINFGQEPLRAVGGKRYGLVWVSLARQEDGSPGYFGATVADIRVDPAKKEGFRDLSAQGMKFNESARGRVEVSRLKPDEREALANLLRAQTALWESAFENVRNAFG